MATLITKYRNSRQIKKKDNFFFHTTNKKKRSKNTLKKTLSGKNFRRGNFRQNTPKSTFLSK